MPESSTDLSQRIAEIQAKQAAMMEQTTQELALLKESLEVSERMEAERDELQELREIIKQHEQEKIALRSALHETNSQLRNVIHGVKEAINIAVPGEAIILEAPKNISLEQPKPEKAKEPKPEKKRRSLFGRKEKKKEELPKIAEVKIPKVKKEEKPKKKSGSKKTLLRLATLIGLVSVGYITLSHSPFASSSDTNGSVAGVSTISETLDTTIPTKEDVTLPAYDESFSDVPFENTIWETTTDSAFGISIEYPKNTTNRVGAVGGNNIWFLRKNGYLLKLTREDYKGSLDQWISDNKNLYEEENTLLKSTFKDLPAWLIQPLNRGEAIGYQYIVAKNDRIYEVWIKQEDAESADGQRVARMITSLRFL